MSSGDLRRLIEGTDHAGNMEEIELPGPDEWSEEAAGTLDAGHPIGMGQAAANVMVNAAGAAAAAFSEEGMKLMADNTVVMVPVAGTWTTALESNPYHIRGVNTAPRLSKVGTLTRSPAPVGTAHANYAAEATEGSLEPINFCYVPAAVRQTRALVAVASYRCALLEGNSIWWAGYTFLMPKDAASAYLWRGLDPSTRLWRVFWFPLANAVAINAVVLRKEREDAAAETRQHPNSTQPLQARTNAELRRRSFPYLPWYQKPGPFRNACTHGYEGAHPPEDVDLVWYAPDPPVGNPRNALEQYVYDQVRKGEGVTDEEADRLTAEHPLIVYQVKLRRGVGPDPYEAARRQKEPQVREKAQARTPAACRGTPDLRNALNRGRQAPPGKEARHPSAGRNDRDRYRGGSPGRNRRDSPGRDRGGSPRRLDYGRSGRDDPDRTHRPRSRSPPRRHQDDRRRSTERRRDHRRADSRSSERRSRSPRREAGEKRDRRATPTPPGRPARYSGESLLKPRAEALPQGVGSMDSRFPQAMATRQELGVTAAAPSRQPQAAPAAAAAGNAVGSSNWAAIMLRDMQANTSRQLAERTTLAADFLKMARGFRSMYLWNALLDLTADLARKTGAKEPLNDAQLKTCIAALSDDLCANLVSAGFTLENKGNVDTFVWSPLDAPWLTSCYRNNSRARPPPLWKK
jgi:hypothetical protein